jgi:hypothetical protein
MINQCIDKYTLSFATGTPICRRIRSLYGLFQVDSKAYICLEKLWFMEVTCF